MPRRSQKPSTEITAADRKARAVALRSRGYSFQAIADELGYANASGASKAYHAALRERPAQNVDQIRAQEAERLEWLWRKTADIVENPGPKSSAIGKIVVYPPGHEKAGQPVPDTSTAIRAATEYRHQSESFRKLVSADSPPAEAGAYASSRAAAVIAEINEVRARLGQPPMGLPAPARGPQMTEEAARLQAANDMRARTTDPAGGLFIPPGIVAGGSAAISAWVSSQAYYATQRPADTDADVIDAEIVDDD